MLASDWSRVNTWPGHWPLIGGCWMGNEPVISDFTLTIALRDSDFHTKATKLDLQDTNGQYPPWLYYWASINKLLIHSHDLISCLPSYDQRSVCTRKSTDTINNQWLFTMFSLIFSEPTFIGCVIFRWLEEMMRKRRRGPGKAERRSGPRSGPGRNWMRGQGSRVTVNRSQVPDQSPRRNILSGNRKLIVNSKNSRNN